MQKKTNVNGFAIIELLIIIAVVLVLGVVGVLVYNQQHKPKSDATATSSTNSSKDKTSTSNSKQTVADPYAGWSTFTVGSTGLTVRYPANWTASDGAAQSDGSQVYKIKAPASELADISLSPVNEQLTSYGVNISVEAKQSNTPGVKGVPVGAQGNSQVIDKGALKGKYVLVTGDAADGTSQTFVLSNSYNPTQKIDESGILAINGVSIGIGSSFMAGQDIGDANISSFLSSQLYKDTLSILNSFATN